MKKTNNKLIRLPGLVDVHVHLREPGGTQKEDFETGTQAAVAGGYTQILDMPNNKRPTVSTQALNQKIKLAKNRIYCDLGFNFGAIPQATKYFPKVRKRVFGLKIFMAKSTGPLRVSRKQDWERIFKFWRSNLPIMIHARAKSVEEAIRLSDKYNKAIHVCHVTGDQISTIEKAKKSGIDISCEVTPHHLFLSQKDIKRLGALGIMRPSLSPEKDRKILWEKIDVIDMVATDHAPHALLEKYEKPSETFGVPGLETMLPLMLSAVKRKSITIEKLVEMTSTIPRTRFRLPTQQRTFIEVDMTKEYKIASEGLYTKCGWTPFMGMKTGGRVVKVVIRGKTVFLDGKFVGSPQGRVISPVAS